MFLNLLGRSATGQQLTVYTEFINGPRAANQPDGPEHMHVVFMDNGRSDILASNCREILRCIRCGACQNVCPVYRQASGHAYRSPYGGPVGAVLSPVALRRPLPRNTPTCRKPRRCAARATRSARWTSRIPDLLLRLRDKAHRAGIHSPAAIPMSPFAMLATSPGALAHRHDHEQDHEPSAAPSRADQAAPGLARPAHPARIPRRRIPQVDQEEKAESEVRNCGRFTGAFNAFFPSIPVRIEPTTPHKSMKLETLCLHAGYSSDPTTHACAVPVYRTASYVFDSTEHAANLFALRELGNIYTRLMNPTHDVLEQRVAALEGGAAGLAVASGTSAIFYSIINLAQAGDNIVSARNLYGGTYTQFKDILPALGIEVRFVDSTQSGKFRRRHR